MRKCVDLFLTLGMLLSVVISFIGMFSYRMEIVIVSGAVTFLMLALAGVEESYNRRKFQKRMNENREVC